MQYDNRPTPPALNQHVHKAEHVQLSHYLAGSVILYVQCMSNVTEYDGVGLFVVYDEFQYLALAGL